MKHLIYIRYIISIAIFFCVAGYSYSQEKGKKEKLRSYSSYSQKKAPQLSVDELLKLGEEAIDDEPQVALQYIYEALASSISKQEIEKEGKAYFLLGKINYRLKQYDLAINNLEKSREITGNLKEKNSTKIRGTVSYEHYQVHQFLGLSYTELGQFKEAIEQLSISLSYAELRGIQKEIDQIRSDLAEAFLKNGDSDKALEQYKVIIDNGSDSEESKKKNIASGKSFKGSKTQNSGPEAVMKACNAIGEILSAQDKNEEALKYFTKAQEIAESQNDKEFSQLISSNIGKNYRKENKLSEELDWRVNTIQRAEAQDNKVVLQVENQSVGDLYNEYYKEPSKAIPYLEKSVKLSEEIGGLQAKAEALNSLSLAYSNTQDYPKALNTYREYMDIMNKLYTQKESKIVSTLQVSNELKNQQQRIALLEQDQTLNEKTIEILKQDQELNEARVTRQNILSISLSGGLILMIFGAVVVGRSWRQKKLANQLLVLKSLRSQMNPHFIFNSLNSVNNFIAKSDERSANKYLSEFSILMREVMKNSQEDFVPLANEIKILELYLKLEHSRFAKKFDYTFKVDETIDTEAYQIPPMLIQPYIENSVWHGLRYLEEKGSLDVSMEKRGEVLVVRIADDGIGRKKSQEQKTANQLKNVSTGMKNIENRLKIINDVYGMALTVDIRDKDSATGSGTIVEINIPMKKT